ncbi:hypothetical protein KO488_04660 [Poseidonibacter lekithochrous]|uniref:hypothetical protein n=1 Tax=Poseidonibacter TaxID=2321187 RepID=UPI001C085806|nr:MULTISPECIES: hypothetical protein [Poseidonibacter]MBU3014038.1 hypothetical protein [Poseidonibacter lekithochrous]MDO6827334.1 hypothetical protein [Poseidonibacter sp. 1_MG-2023]
MVVLLVLGVVTFYIFVLFLMIKTNRYTNIKRGKEFFHGKYLFVYFISFTLIYYGYEWYEEAIESNGDILNGIILIILAAILLVLVIIRNIKSSNFIFGITITIVQIILYMPILIFTMVSGFTALFCIVWTIPFML